jgi:hypothetical protein
VNSDCTISVTLMDVFNTTSNAVGANATQGTSTLIGLVVAGGAEVYLSQAQSTSSTNGNTPLVTGQFASRLSIQLVRTYAYACTAANLTGSYGSIGHGYVLVTSSASTGTGTGGTGGTGTGTGGTGTGTGTSTTSSTVQPVALLGVVTFDGAGNLIQETVASGSPLGSFQYKGTYTLNLDCAGTMTLTPASSSTTTTTTGTGTTTSSSSALTVNFVLTPPITFLTTSAYSASPSGNASRPGLAFNLMSSTETLFGTGIAQ